MSHHRGRLQLGSCRILRLHGVDSRDISSRRAILVGGLFGTFGANAFRTCRINIGVVRSTEFFLRRCFGVFVSFWTSLASRRFSSVSRLIARSSWSAFRFFNLFERVEVVT